MTPPIKDLLPRLTPILKNRHEKVQENCIDLVGRIADRGAEFVPAREWMRICFELLEMLKVRSSPWSLTSASLPPAVVPYASPLPPSFHFRLFPTAPRVFPLGVLPCGQLSPNCLIHSVRAVQPPLLLSLSLLSQVDDASSVADALSPCFALSLSPPSPFPSHFLRLTNSYVIP